ncbi:hypothetical protein BDV93DRAFT_559018 [Ceratobasidium sp. AG-I]|nr:hypothetical protein BDV93DRAFT_559018 [Ceratobasidium sp. AG-I]
MQAASPPSSDELTMGIIKYGSHGGPGNATGSPVARIPSKQIRGFMSLPIELVAIIAQHLWGMGRISDLAAFAQLLSLQGRYTRALQEVLFARIHLDSYERYASLTRTLQCDDTPQHSRQLALMVRSISATLNAQPAPGQEAFLAKHLLNLYDQCPQLSHITLSGMSDRPPQEHSIQTLRDSYPIEQLVAIKSLTLHCPPDPLGLSLLCRLPHLAELRIVGGPLRFQFGDLPPRSGSSIRQVTWGSITPLDVPSIQWLFHSVDAMGGELTLLNRSHTDLQLEEIRNYVRQHGMIFHLPPSNLAEGEV